METLRQRAALFALVIAGAACSSAGTGTSPGAAGAAGTGSGATAGAGGNSGWTGGGGSTAAGLPSPTCARYVECVSVTDAAAFPEALQAYGPSGNCWKGDPQIAESCNASCQLALSSANQTWPEEPKCGLCQSSAECASPEQCDPGTHRCVDMGKAVVACLDVLVEPLVGQAGLATCGAVACPNEFAECFSPNSPVCPSFAKCVAACSVVCDTQCIGDCFSVQEPSCAAVCPLSDTAPLVTCALAACAD